MHPARQLLLPSLLWALASACSPDGSGPGTNPDMSTIEPSLTPPPPCLDPEIETALPEEWSVESNEPFAQLGFRATGAGDVNGDGYSDVIVAAWRYDTAVVDAGRAWIYLGSRDGPELSAVWTWGGDSVGERMGYSVSGAGDVNGDGYDDVIVGAPRYDGGQTDEGAALLFLGSPLGPSTVPDWVAEGNQDRAWFGRWVSDAGDVNADGFDDIIIGAHRYNSAGVSDVGSAYVYLGSALGPSLLPDWRVLGQQANAQLGREVGSAGDVNDDGFDDVLVVAGEDGLTNVASEQRVYLFAGSPSGVETTPLWTAEGVQPSSVFGYSVAGKADVNGDGFDDVFVGATRYADGEADEGRVYAFHGSPTGPGALHDWAVESDQLKAYLGGSLAGVRDWDGDGFDDLIVGSDGYDGDLQNQGRIFLFRGSPTGLEADATWFAESDQEFGQLGISVASAGDTNGDGHPDIVAGARRFDGPELDEGRAYVFLGRPLCP